MILGSGCGTTVKESFDPIPTSAAVSGQTGLPVASKITLQDSAPNIIFTGANDSVENGAVVSIYNDSDVLLANGTADANGAFNIIFVNTTDSTFLITAAASGKTESNSVSFQKM